MDVAFSYSVAVIVTSELDVFARAKAVARFWLKVPHSRNDQFRHGSDGCRDTDTRDERSCSGPKLKDTQDQDIALADDPGPIDHPCGRVAGSQNDGVVCR